MAKGRPRAFDAGIMHRAARQGGGQPVFLRTVGLKDSYQKVQKKAAK